MIVVPYEIPQPPFNKGGGAFESPPFVPARHCQVR